MRTTAKAYDDHLNRIDFLSRMAVDSYNYAKRFRSSSDYYEGRFHAFQLSISILAWQMPKFASDALTDHPSPKFGMAA